MGFKEGRKRLIVALKEGKYSHEVRDVLAEKNLLAIGDIGERWYVKAYFLEDSPGDAVFISAHR